MTSVQENKNELEAAVRYCESAISRAKATIESMEFRQQVAKKAWHEQTGREAALEREVSELKIQLVEERDRSMGYTKEVEELKQANMGLVCDNDDLKEELEQRISEVADLKVQQQTMEQTMQLQKDQIAMFQRKMTRLNEVDR
jgi:chromosome segregation ATPase